MQTKNYVDNWQKIGKQFKLITDMTSKFQMGEMPWTKTIPV